MIVQLWRGRRIGMAVAVAREEVSASDPRRAAARAIGPAALLR